MLMVFDLFQIEERKKVFHKISNKETQWYLFLTIILW